MDLEGTPAPGMRPEPRWLRVVRLVATYLELAVGAVALVLAVVLVATAFMHGDHGAPYLLLGAAMLVFGGGLLVVGGLALRKRHPLWWIPHLMFVVPLLWDFLATKFR